MSGHMWEQFIFVLDAKKSLERREWGDEIMREEDKGHSSDNFFWRLVIQNESF